MIWRVQFLNCFDEATVISSLAMKVESFWGEVDVEDFDEAVGEEEPRLRLQCLPSAEPQGCYELRGWGETHMLYKSLVVFYSSIFKWLLVKKVLLSRCRRVNVEAPWSLSAMKPRSSTSRKSLVTISQTSCPTLWLTCQTIRVQCPPWGEQTFLPDLHHNHRISAG